MKLKKVLALALSASLFVSAPVTAAATTASSETVVENSAST